MNILIIGAGGREHTIAWKIKQSNKTDKIFAIPGNAGISKLAECFNIDIMDNNALIEFAKEHDIGLTIVGPEIPLVNGIVDEFEKNSLRILGPNKEAAQIEGSKVFSKILMQKYNVPTGKAEIFDNPEEAIEFVKNNDWARVIKADGPAAGKGVIICDTEEEAIDAINKILVDKEFGDVGNQILVEEKLAGEEASFIVFTDGNAIKPMVTSQDHKRVFDDDKGLNTGGMGAYSPAPVITEELSKEVINTVIKPTIDGMKAEGISFKGFLYAGLMITENGIKVLEFNARLGDPETQVILPRLKTDLVEVANAVVDGNLGSLELEWDNRPAVSVVLASGGYPEHYEKGKVITGLDEAEKLAIVFHAGTRLEGSDILTNGGRVLNVTALGDSIKDAIDKSYEAVEKIKFDGAHYRKDIGFRALERD
tara:strand:+ start:10078 stop:11346 length:1269 start_codon:yes stop_codon:yes gene_type:complete